VINHSILNLAVQDSNQEPMFEEIYGKFSRSHSEGTGKKEHCFYDGEIFQITFKVQCLQNA
jgi:hypothetical protein